MTKSTTRTLLMAALFAGAAGLAGCAGNHGYDSGTTDTSAQAPMTSDMPTTSSGTTAEPMAPAPAAQP